MEKVVTNTLRTLQDGLQTAAGLILAALLAGCTYPPISFESENSPSQVLAPGESISLRFFTSVADFDSGIRLQEGTDYNLDIMTLSHWVDGDIEENEEGAELDERGFANSEMPFEFLGVARRSRQHRWFELMLYQPACAAESLRGVTDLDVTEEDNNSYNFVAACDGKLTLFVNDSYGFYLNNTGFAGIALSRVN